MYFGDNLIPIILWSLVFYRSLRNKLPRQILISFCFSLLCLYVVFVFGIERTKPEAVCVSVSVLLHYFTLTSIAWMAVEAFNMYVLFVYVIGRWAHISKFLLKASLLAWGKLNCERGGGGTHIYLGYTGDLPLQCVVGRSQPHSSGWAKVPISSLSSNFDQIVLYFLIRSFSSSFWPSGWASRSSEKAQATPLVVFNP